MTRFGWLVVGVTGGILILLVGAFLWLHASNSTPTPMATTEATSTPNVDLSSLSIYTSGQYGFTFFYPAAATLADEFSASTSSPLPWRGNASTAGTMVVRVGTLAGEVRIGFSTAPKAVAACTKAGPAEHTQSVFSNGSTTWSRFTFDNVGTDNEQHITSYRTVHDDTCYALEAYVPFASAATASSSPAFGPEDIIHSFSFAGV